MECKIIFIFSAHSFTKICFLLPDTSCCSYPCCTHTQPSNRPCFCCCAYRNLHWQPHQQHPQSESTDHRSTLYSLHTWGLLLLILLCFLPVSLLPCYLGDCPEVDAVEADYSSLLFVCRCQHGPSSWTQERTQWCEWTPFTWHDMMWTPHHSIPNLDCTFSSWSGGESG